MREDERARLTREGREPQRRDDDANPAAWLGRVTTAAPAVGHFMNCTPLDLTGAEAEGALPTLTAVAPDTAVYLAGPQTPAAGDVCIVEWNDFRWVAARNGVGATTPTAPLPGCPCLRVPKNLWLHVARQPPGRVEAVVFPSPLTYGPPPAELSAYKTDNPGWYGNKFQSSDLFYRFIYWFGCSQGSYFVGGLLTPDSPLGFPGFFLIASFLVGVPGNTCTPYSLAAPATGNPTFQQQGIKIDGVAEGPMPGKSSTTPPDAGVPFFFLPTR